MPRRKSDDCTGIRVCVVGSGTFVLGFPGANSASKVPDRFRVLTGPVDGAGVVDPPEVVVDV